MVNGREGAPIDIMTGDEILLPDGTEFVDLATLLTDPKADLEPAATWINVTLTTPDGVVTAWVNTQYLDVKNPRGEKQRLADLPVVPRNQPGEAVGTIVTTPIPAGEFRPCSGLQPR